MTLTDIFMYFSNVIFFLGSLFVDTTVGKGKVFGGTGQYN